MALSIATAKSFSILGLRESPSGPTPDDPFKIAEISSGSSWFNFRSARILIDSCDDEDHIIRKDGKWSDKRTSFDWSSNASSRSRFGSALRPADSRRASACVYSVSSRPANSI